jgi:hypothetical protein
MHDVVRFRARMITRNTVDATRLLIITFYLSDDTNQIYEPRVRNSGIIGCKYLQRMRVDNPETGEYFEASDLEVGRIVILNKQRFEHVEATEYAKSSMEADADTFPQAELAEIVERLLGCIARAGRRPKEMFSEYSDHGHLDLNNLLELFRGVGYEITCCTLLQIVSRSRQCES